MLLARTPQKAKEVVSIGKRGIVLMVISVNTNMILPMEKETIGKTKAQGESISGVD